jgi:hypothetical protein
MKSHWKESLTDGYRKWTSTLPAIKAVVEEWEDNGGHSIPKTGRPTVFSTTIGGRSIFRVSPAYSESDMYFASPEDAALAVENKALEAAQEILRTLTA